MRRLITFIAVTAMLLSSAPAFAQGLDDAIALHIGSPLIFAEGRMKALDPDNPNVVPVIHKDRTLVPLRAVSEHFGAAVDYDDVKREAIITYGGKSYYFPIGKNHYRILEQGKDLRTVTYDTEALIIENRTMVPLRLISEDIFGLQVGYREKAITIGSGDMAINDEMLSVIRTRIGQALKPATEAELLAQIKAMNIAIIEKERLDIMPMPSQDAVTGGESAPSEPGDYSQTNEQVEGVNEADVVKTDGKFIYVASGKSVRIYDANNGKPFLTDEITVKVDDQTGQFTQFTELYIHDGKLIVLGEKGRFGNWIRPVPDAPEERMIMPYYDQYEGFVYTGIYSVSTQGKLSLDRELEVEGSLLSSRKKDDTLYLVVNKYLYSYGPMEEPIIPAFRDSAVSDDLKELAIDKVMYFPRRAASNYLTIAAVDVEKPSQPANIEAFLGTGNLIYMSRDALYVAGQDYHTIWGSITNIAKFNVDGTKIGFAGGGLVEGTILNQFSMDEYEGNLRIATTNWQRESVNAVYILDEDLNPLGAVENLAPGERIFSTRFMGDYGYIVTFRQVDPLFVLDLSNPSKPRVTGELKIPGFSSYLHPVTDKVLLGIGRDVDENTGMQNGIKLSLFDVSDEGRPKEMTTLILGGPGSYAEVLDNHKALMLNLNDDMIAFDVSLSDITDKYVKTSFNGAAVIEVRPTGSIKVLELISSEGLYGSYAKRLVYIGDKLYYIIDDNIRAFDMDDFKEIK